MSVITENFLSLLPEDVLDAVESFGLRATGEYIQLNSYENRVFLVKLEDYEGQSIDSSVIAKFYRPGRWSHESINDEHEFLDDLKSEGIEAVAPFKRQGESIGIWKGLFFSLFPRIRGRNPQELSLEDLRRVGQTIGRIHNVGAQKPAENRLSMHPETYGWQALERLENWAAPEIWNRYCRAAEDIFEYLEDNLSVSKFIRIHGDCHKGNLIDDGSKFYFVDFDDFCNGPPIQDLWMLLNDDSAQENMAILEGYEQVRRFDRSLLRLKEPLRGLRIINYAGWIAERWLDPSFQRLFPGFRDFRYWAEEVEALEKIAWQLD